LTARVDGQARDVPSLVAQRLNELPRDAQRLLRRRRPGLAARVTWEVKRRRGDYTMTLVERLVHPGDHAVDAGANWGLFTARLAELTGATGRVTAFEPNPGHGHTLGAIAERHPWVKLELAALSEEPGAAELAVPVHEGRELSALASLDPGEQPDDVRFRKVAVAVTTLDDALGEDVPPVCFVKCDVEGHELAALRGGERMLRRDRPAILLEAEQRHQPEGASVTDVFDFLRWLGYRGWCVRGDRIAPIGGFDVERDQLAFLRDAGFVAHDMPEGYVNSFLFQAPATAS
jgi:FkbM family methyltransferase